MFRSRALASLALRPGARPAISTRIYAGSSTRPWISQGASRVPTLRAWETTAALTADDVPIKDEEKEDGHISVKSNESVLFFDNIFPLRLSNIIARPGKTDRDVSQLLQRFETSSFGVMDPIRLVKTAIPDDMPIKVTEIVPRLKDGGAFVKFQYDATQESANIEEQLIKKLNERPIKPWFNPFRGIKARLVRGTPWLEDLHRYPTNLLKVEFVAPEPGQNPEELSEENLYALFRKYGKIADIIPQPTDSKILPKYAQLHFPLMRDAVMARNCMHGFIAKEAFGGGKTGTRLKMSYEKRVRAHSIWKWVTNHPRIVIPAIAALIAGISVIIFDPIRQFFIKVHIQHSLHFTESRIYKWFRSKTGNFSFGKKTEHKDGLSTIWNHRRDLIDQLRSWLDGSSDTFIVITGPRGSGKKEMVMDQALEGRMNVLSIDCRPIVEARGETGTIRKLAMAVGYRPVFSWATSISSMVDLAVQSTTGVKAGFSETLESQLNKILYTTAAALKDTALDERSKKDKDADASEDAYLESHPEKRPVVVINNFLHKAEDKGIVYDKIGDWAASIVQNNIAHVIFLTSDSGYTKQLSKALPDRVLRSLSLGDLDLDVARQFVVSRLEEDTADKKDKNKKDEDSEDSNSTAVLEKPDIHGLDECIETVGGRLTDLEFLSRRIKTGQNPKAAVDEIVGESATDIVRMFLTGKTLEDDKKYSTQQAWYLIKALAASPTLRYNSVVLAAPFSSSTSTSAKDPDTALDSLVNAELISVGYHQGRPSTISAGKPLSQAAFGVLIKDRVLKAKMDIGILKEMAKVEEKDIETVENELALLGSLPKQPAEMADRVQYLLQKLQGSQTKVAKLEQDVSGLKKILESEY